MKFIDTAKICIKSGKGGNGCISFRREKYIERGGPNGGNGGKGGDVYFEGDESFNTLADFKYKVHHKAENGHHGRGKSQNGKHGEDLIITVPLGIKILDPDSEEELLNITKHKEKKLFSKGSIGGKGNEFFKSSTNKAPRFAQEGEETEEIWVKVELNILADVGLIGLPNAGKSTLLNSITNANSNIGNYKFTTLYPFLGVLRKHYKDIIIADLPGLIENAHKGVGLGNIFLAHIKKCKTLVHLIDSSSDNLLNDYDIIINELSSYDENLLQTPHIIALSKIDLITSDKLLDNIQMLQKHTKDNYPLLNVINITEITQNDPISISNISDMIYNLLNNKVVKEDKNTTWNPL